MALVRSGRELRSPRVLTKLRAESLYTTESESETDIVVEIRPLKESTYLLAPFPVAPTPLAAAGVPLVGFALLLCSFCTISSLGVAFDLMAGVSPILKLFWKVSGTCCVTTVLCLPKLRGIFTGTVVVPKRDALVMCALGYCLWNCTFIWALEHTSVGHAYILNNSHSLVLVMGKILCRRPVALQEAIGTVIGIAGGVVTALDHTVSRTKAVGPSLDGDIVAFLGAVGAAFYLTNAKTVRNQAGMDFMVFMWLHMCTVCVILLPLLAVFTESLSISTHPVHGLFGWLDASRLPFELYLVAVCDFVGGMGYVRVLKYFEPIVVSIVMLLEPVLAVCLGIAVGVSNVPGLLTICGSAVVILGTAMVIHSSTQRPTTVPVKPAPSYGTTA
ncbi:Drug/Metabolite Transporter (DMT) Superfamily [Achlya hypogyna]|uniref:Drug/Metabolite Transporter (DMT) Superfamily n=1 Tax=Achlya hypogyna TaxID=1202772 RepID=A0A1V9YGB2_ACHHY|nr:Drug/Metabolite Transporter (DMT) Superfamily [Achlya hypogyna]